MMENTEKEFVPINYELWNIDFHDDGGICAERVIGFFKSKINHNDDYEFYSPVYFEFGSLSSKNENQNDFFVFGEITPEIIKKLRKAHENKREYLDDKQGTIQFFEPEEKEGLEK